MLSANVLSTPQFFICGIKTNTILNRLRDSLCQLHSMTYTTEMNRYPIRMTSDYSLVRYLCSCWAEMVTASWPLHSQIDQRQNCKANEFVLIYLECISTLPFPIFLSHFFCAIGRVTPGIMLPRFKSLLHPSKAARPRAISLTDLSPILLICKMESSPQPFSDINI